MNFKPIFIFLPQKDDLIFIKNHEHFFQNFSNELSTIKNLVTLDVVHDLLSESNLDDLYSDNNDYGGHYSDYGNKKISQLIYQKLKNSSLI